MAVRYQYKLLLNNDFEKVMERLCKGFKANPDVRTYYLTKQIGQIRTFLLTERHKAINSWISLKADFKKEHPEAKDMEMPTEILESFMDTEIGLPDEFSKLWPLAYSYFSKVDLDAIELPLIEPLMKVPDMPDEK